MCPRDEFDQETLVLYKNEFHESNEEDKIKDAENKNDNFRKLLADVEDLLNDEEMIKVIMEQWEKGVTEEEYAENRGKRIDLMLEMAGGYKYDDYILAIKKTRKHGSIVLLKRDVDEIFVNNYNPEWINAWNANVDIQPVLDFFAVITYVTDYWANSDEGITQHLKEAA